MNISNKKSINLCLLTAFAVGLFAVLLSVFKNGLSIQEILNFSSKKLILAVLFLMLIYAVKSVVMVIPLMGLYLAGGAMFSSVYMGMAVNLMGIAIALTVPYFLGVKLGYAKLESLEKRFPRLKELSLFQKNNARFFSYIIRVMGILPCDVVSLYCGIHKIPYFKYLFGSIIGMLPGLILTSIMGANISNPGSPQFIIATSFQISTTLISVVIYKKLKEKNNYQED